MPGFADHYRTLQVHQEASQEVIEAAYRRLCRIYHPDVNRESQALVRMQEINAAYEVLGVPSRRKEYTRQWLAATARPAAPAAPAASPQPERRRPEELARQALEAYFRHLMDGRWAEAYRLLTAVDRRSVPLEDFCQWKDTVARCYRMGSFVVKPFRRYLDCAVSGSVYREVYEFSAFVCDMDCRSGHISEENYLKYVAMEDGCWRVCLGYSDVKPLILRFKYMQENSALLDPAQVYAEAVLNRDQQTGLLSRQGFAERAEAEAVRSRRYGNPFTVALLRVRPRGEAVAFSGQEYGRMCVVHAARAIAPFIRQTDILGRWSAEELILLFTETPKHRASLAVEKLARKFRQGGELRYDCAFGIAQFDGSQFEDTVAAAASDAQVRRQVFGGIARTTVTVGESV